MRKIVNDNIHGMRIDEFFPGGNVENNPCLENNKETNHISAHVIKLLSQLVDEKKQKRYEDLDLEKLYE